MKYLNYNIIPEAIAILIISRSLDGNLAQSCLLLLIYAVAIRLIWQSVIIVHGLGHTIAIAASDRELSAINLINILEHQSIADILSSLLPCHPIFIPAISPRPQPYLKLGKPHHIKTKALGGIVLNLLVAACCSYSHSWFAQALIVANLLIALSSLSDMKAFITGVADYLYCGNFGLIAQRQPDDGNQLLPDRMLKIALQMGRETEVRGEQAGGGLVIGKNGNSAVFVGKKIVNRKRGNLTQSLEAAFAPIRHQAIAVGVKPVESSAIGVWHYRYATSGTAPSVLETHWHEWIGARNQEVWQFTGREWICEVKNVHHRITHNGDFNSWQIFNRQIDSITLGLWLERVLHTPNATQGDSPKIAGMMNLLVTQGRWYSSVRLAYQQVIATAIEDAFDGQKPTTNALNTAPSRDKLNTWAQICDRVFIEELANLKRSNSSKLDPASLKFSASLQQNLIRALKSHNSTLGWSQLHLTTFVQFALQTFFDNDLYRATQIFISRARGSFGLVTTSTLEEAELVLCARGQPITVGFNWSEGYMVYASEPAAIDRILLNKQESFRLDLDREGGEVAKVSAKNLTVYSLMQQRELQVLELQDRWISMQDHPHLDRLKPREIGRDPIANDINSIPRVLHEIKTDWENPTSLNRRSANYLVYLLVEKVQRFEKRQRLMFKAGLLSKIRKMPAVDLLITGEENSLWLGEKFAQDLRVVFPFLNIVTVSANQILQQLNRSFSQLNLGQDSLVLAITQSGQTFSTVQAIDVFDHLSSQGIIGELFILTGELSSFINSTQGNGGLTTITHSSFLDNKHNRALDSRYRIFVNGSGRRTAEPSTVAVAAAGQTLTELLFYLAKQMRHKFPHSAPLGMTLTTESLMVLGMMKEDFINKNVLQIIGTNAKGEPIKSAIAQTLMQSGRHWANHVTETPVAWAIHALYIVMSVGWVIPFGHTLPVVKTLLGLLFNLLNLPTDLIQFLAPLITCADIAVYIFGAWLWTLAIRYFQGRQLLARTGQRTLIIGDVSWVNQLLQAYVSKLFSLSYGIATIEVHSANPQDHLLHAFGHRIVRGTLIWLGIPDGRRSQQQQEAENAVIMTGKQANGVKNLKIGAEIIALGNDPQIAHQGFSQAVVLNSNNDAIYFRNAAVAEQKEQIEELRESCFGSWERLLAGYVFFGALAKKVAAFPLLKYEYWKSQSRTKVMTTASPVGGFDLNQLNKARSPEKTSLSKYIKHNTN
ncbi:hypothetical protein IQ255_16590 [Pleurocapsales cyanobacterium LEGE 10410]|nr:hypothetical protein [Pleurocapsales cyanobacterium LEGE 10410]